MKFIDDEVEQILTGGPLGTGNTGTPVRISAWRVGTRRPAWNQAESRPPRNRNELSEKAFQLLRVLPVVVRVER